MIPLGILAASGVQAAGSYDLLESQVLTGSAASVTFSSLSAYASTYQHLQFRVVGQSSRAADNDNLTMRFNGDSSTNYSFHRLSAQTSVVSNAGTNQTRISIPGFGASFPSYFSGHVIDILDFANSSKYTTVRALGGVGPVLVGLFSGSWRNTAAVDSVTFDTDVAGDIKQYSRFSLYGVKKAA